MSSPCEPTHLCQLLIPASYEPVGANFALDIGGSLAKLAYIPHESKRTDGKNITLTLVSFDTERLDECLTYIRNHVISTNNHIHRHIRGTGVSCLKHRQEISDELSVHLHVDNEEMKYMARGVDLLWRLLPPEKLVHAGSEIKDYSFTCPLVSASILPCLLVNLGSAMTIIQINADGTASGVVGGSAQGGLTFVGLGALLTSARTYSELVELAERGDRRNVDLLVKDAAGSHYNVAPDHMVSSFGKVAKTSFKNPNSHFKEEDVAHSLLYSITDQLAQTAYLTAKAQGVNTAIFCGTYLSANTVIIQQIVTKLKQCALYLNHELSPVFMRHEGYLGAIGGLFDGKLPVNQDNCSE